MWIQRELSEIIHKDSSWIQVLKGPRQCGKTSLFLHDDNNFEEASLDDPHLRALAQEDPTLFLKQYHSKKVFIDEAQYAPELFPSLKRIVDLEKRTNNKSRTLFRLTGSNQILMDKNVKESLAGRASFFNLNTLSVSELLNSYKSLSIQEIIYKGGWPEVYSANIENVQQYLDNFITSYIEKDIVLSAGIKKVREFQKFIRLLAGRVAQTLDYSSLSRDVGVDTKTISEWISILENMHVIALCPAYFTNLNNRLTKAPKIYFLDTGLACRLQGWTAPQNILTSPQQGPLFENLVYAELHKHIDNNLLSWKLSHWRTKEKMEIDFLIEKEPNDFLFIEAKVSPRKILDPKSHPEVVKIFKNNIPRLLLCHQEGEKALGNNIPISLLTQNL